MTFFFSFYFCFLFYFSISCISVFFSFYFHRADTQTSSALSTYLNGFFSLSFSLVKWINMSKFNGSHSVLLKLLKFKRQKKICIFIVSQWIYLMIKSLYLLIWYGKSSSLYLVKLNSSSYIDMIHALVTSYTNSNVGLSL